MAKVKDFIDYLLTTKTEFTNEDIKKKFVIVEDDWRNILKILLEKQWIVEIEIGKYKMSDTFSAAPGYTSEILTPLIKHYFSGRDNNPAEIGRIGWDTVKNIDKFKVYPADEMKIYEIHFKGKIIRIEGKDIMEYDVFILKLFEVFGIMLPKYKNLSNDWAALVSYWMQNFGEVVESHAESLSVQTEAVDVVVSYINHAVVSDDYIVKDGFITYKNGILYVPTKCIKKLLRREDLLISLRKLAYFMKDYLVSGSVSLKVENKSERFWKLHPKKFEVKLDDKIKLEQEPDESDEDSENPKQKTLAEPNVVEVVKSLDPVPVPKVNDDSDINQEDEEG